MKTLIVKNITSGTSTNTEAMSLFLEMAKNVDNSEPTTLSFIDVSYVSSSFLNSSIGEFIDKYGFDFFAKNIRFTNCKSDLAALIKGYVNKYKTTAIH